MSTVSISEGNKMIAEFMGYEKRENAFQGRPVDFLIDKYWTTPEKMKYHSSWDWLKQAIDKYLQIPIETFNYNATAMAELRNRKKSLGSLTINQPISNFWNELVKGITWYNSLTPKQQ